MGHFIERSSLNHSIFLKRQAEGSAEADVARVENESLPGEEGDPTDHVVVDDSGNTKAIAIERGTKAEREVVVHVRLNFRCDGVAKPCADSESDEVDRLKSGLFVPILVGPTPEDDDILDAG